MIFYLLRFPPRHWTGALPPAPAILGVVLGGRLVVFALGGLWLPIDLALFVWQVVGGFRSLNRHLDHGPHLTSYLGGLMALLVCTVLTALPHIDQLARREAVPVPPWQAEVGDVTVVDDQVILRGEIRFPMLNTLELVLKETPDLRELLLDSPGGRVHAARGISKLVTEHGLNTRVDHTCASACTLIFIAGLERTLAPDGKLGFHAYSLQTNQVLADPVKEQDKDRKLFLAKNVSSDFLDQIEATPHETMWFPSHEELRTAGVTTSP